MKTLIAFFCALTTAHPALAAVYRFNPDAGKVEFRAKGRPALIAIHGEGRGANGALNDKDGKLNGELSFALGTLDTGIALRDEHMKEKYLEVGKYPDARLEIKDLAYDGHQEHLPFKGVLHLHGVEQPVQGEVTLKHGKGAEMQVNAEFKVKLSEFKIAIPNFQGVTVAEDVQVQIDAKTKME